MSLQADVAYCKKETKILKSEQDTIVDVAKQQTHDIERYLEKETGILSEVIMK